MKIGLIDVDGHNFPNLALMRISAYHKGKGDKCCKKGTANGIMNADPDEEWCEYDSEHFMTDDGCFRYFEWGDDDD